MAERIADVVEILGLPFKEGEVKFKPQVVKGNKALVLAYVDARVVQDRLDDVLGTENWQDDYECLEGGTVLCRLRVRLGEEWLTKVDVGGPSEQPDGGDRVKAAFSDALKRAAVKFGIGRYLYRLPQFWCDYDPATRKFTRPQLPAWALPKAPKPAPSAASVTKPADPPVKAPPAKPSPNDFVTWIRDFEATLVTGGVCEDGDLRRAIRDAAEEHGWPNDPAAWTPAQVMLAKKQAEWVALQMRRQVGNERDGIREDEST